MTINQSHGKLLIKKRRIAHITEYTNNGSGFIKIIQPFAYCPICPFHQPHYFFVDQYISLILHIFPFNNSNPHGFSIILITRIIHQGFYSLATIINQPTSPIFSQNTMHRTGGIFHHGLTTKIVNHILCFFG